MSRTMDVYDVIVVGAGVEGSSTAYQLAKRGKKVLLLEQFPLPHSRGSSHGQSRITRKAYGAKDFYTHMMKDAYRLTDELQRESGEQLFVNCGCLIIGDKDDPYLQETELALVRHKVPHRKLNTATLSHTYPQLDYEDENKAFVLDHSGGFLKADKIVIAYQNLFRKLGGIIRDGEPMTEIVPGTNVTVKTEKGTYTATSVVLTLGPWASKFMPKVGVNVPLQTLKTLALYWKARNPSQFEKDIFPTFRHISGSAPYNIYGFPTFEYPGLVKVCLHRGPEADPDSRDTTNTDWVVQRVKDWVTKHIPGLEPEPSIVEPCFYTVTPDEDYILDRHPKWSNVIIGTGFSGHGFKLAPVIGTILADLATNQRPKYDPSPFKINRFYKSKL